MKFTLTAKVVSDLKGLELDDEYDRLGFEDKRPATFPHKQVVIEVDKEFVKQNRELFKEGNDAVIYIDSSKTEKSDWEDWGSAGMMLSRETMSESRVIELKN